MNRCRWAWLSLIAVLLAAGCKSDPKPAGSNLLVEPLDAQKLGYVSRWVLDLQDGPTIIMARVICSP